MIRTVIIVCLCLCACTEKKPQEKREPKPVSVLVTTPRVCDVPIYIESLGTLLPSASLQLRSQVKGVLKEVHVKEGDLISAGQTLFTIDTTGFSYKRDQAKAQKKLHEAEASACLKKLKRYQALASKDLIAEADWDSLELDAAKAKASLELAEAKLKEAELDLAHCTISSSISGRIGKIDLYPGHIIDETLVLASVMNMDPIVSEFFVTEKEFIRFPQSCQVTVDALSSELSVKGTISFIENEFNPKNGKIKVHATIENPDFTWRPGHSVHVKVPISVITNALLIPHKCVQHTAQGPCLYIVQEDGTCAIRPIKLGEALENEVVVLEGINASDTVISDGHSRISQGIKVQIQS